MLFNLALKVSVVFFLFSIACSIIASAQVGSVEGIVLDEKTEEGIPFANVVMEVNGTLRGAQTDFDGYFRILPIPVGTYQLTISFVGYVTDTSQVEVIENQLTKMLVKLEETSEEIIFSCIRPSLFRPLRSTGTTYTKEEIAKIPIR